MGERDSLVITFMKVLKFGTYIDNDVVINDRTVSRNHVQITQHDYTHFTLLDLGSENGTFVNGVRVSEEVEIHHGDEVRIGNTLLNWEEYFLSDEEKRIREELAALREKEREEYERINNAMCYCRPPEDWHDPKDEKGNDNSVLQKVLSIVTIVIISSVILGAIVAFLLL